MIRFSGFWCLCLCACFFGAGAASASVPDPGLCTIPNVLCVPGGGMSYVVTIVGSSGPVEDASVTLIWTAAADTLVCWCSGQQHPQVTAVTNASGLATFDIAAGGCLDPSQIPGGVAVQVYVNSVLFASVGQVSPDIYSTKSPPCVVGGSDAIYWTPYIAGSIYGFCYDLNSDGAVGGIDAVMLTPLIAGAAHCN